LANAFEQERQQKEYYMQEADYYMKLAMYFEEELVQFRNHIQAIVSHHEMRTNGVDLRSNFRSFAMASLNTSAASSNAGTPTSASSTMAATTSIMATGTNSSINTTSSSTLNMSKHENIIEIESNSDTEEELVLDYCPSGEESEASLDRDDNIMENEYQNHASASSSMSTSKGKYPNKLQWQSNSQSHRKSILSHTSSGIRKHSSSSSKNSLIRSKVKIRPKPIPFLEVEDSTRTLLHIHRKCGILPKRPRGRGVLCVATSMSKSRIFLARNVRPFYRFKKSKYLLPKMKCINQKQNQPAKYIDIPSIFFKEQGKRAILKKQRASHAPSKQRQVIQPLNLTKSKTVQEIGNSIGSRGRKLNSRVVLKELEAQASVAKRGGRGRGRSRGRPRGRPRMLRPAVTHETSFQMNTLRFTRTQQILQTDGQVTSNSNAESTTSRTAELGTSQTAQEQSLSNSATEASFSASQIESTSSQAAATISKRRYSFLFNEQTMDIFTPEVQQQKQSKPQQPQKTTIPTSKSSFDELAKQIFGS
jgi:hypothetical protein